MRVASLPLLVLLLVIALLAAGCGGDDGDAKDAKDAKPAARMVEPDEKFTIQVKDGEVIGGPAVMKAQVGDEVRIDILSDAADEAHLHGFDAEVEVERGVPSSIAVTAKDPGSHDLEFHDSGLVLGSLQVS